MTGGTFVPARPDAIPMLRRGLVGGLGLALALLIGFGWSSILSARGEMAELRGYIAQVEARAADPNRATDRQFYSAATLQLAQTLAQTDLQTIATDHSARIESIQTDRIDQSGGDIRLGLSASGVIPEAQLGAFLADLIAHEPILIVEDLSLRRARAGSRTREQRNIAFQITVSGYSQR